MAELVYFLSLLFVMFSALLYSPRVDDDGAVIIFFLSLLFLITSSLYIIGRYIFS